jgi:sodium/pantothenate symporter
LLRQRSAAGFWRQLAAIGPELILPVNSASPLFRDWFEVIFCNLFVGVAIVCQPHIITRSLMLKRAERCERYLWIAIVAQTVFFTGAFHRFFNAVLQFPIQTSNG